MKKLLLLLPWLLFYMNSQSQIPAGYYNAANGLNGEPLKTALYNIVKDHTVISYTALWNAFTTTDDNAGGNVWDMYSNCTYVFGSDQCGSFAVECDCYNREHSFPDSWFGGGSPMVSDLFQLYPTDGKVNQVRSNFPYGKVSSPTSTTGNGSKLGPCSYPGYTGTVFEPIDMYKGDFARTYFYMATRYENLIASWQSNTGADAVLDGTSFPCYDSWFLQLLGEWHTSDPVSQKEIDRNNEIYANYQHNRNPYIDHPEYVYQVWGIGTPPVTPEPTNFPTGFSAHNILLQWTDASGASVPTGYLVRMSTEGFNSIPVPVDGIPVPGSASDKIVGPGIQQALFSGLTPSTTYYFKIYSYTGSGTTINYKTDGAVPQQQISTSE